MRIAIEGPELADIDFNQIQEKNKECYSNDDHLCVNKNFSFDLILVGGIGYRFYTQTSNALSTIHIPEYKH